MCTGATHWDTDPPKRDHTMQNDVVHCGGWRPIMGLVGVGCESRWHVMGYTTALDDVRSDSFFFIPFRVQHTSFPELLVDESRGDIVPETTLTYWTTCTPASSFPSFMSRSRTHPTTWHEVMFTRAHLPGTNTHKRRVTAVNDESKMLASSLPEESVGNLRFFFFLNHGPSKFVGWTGTL